MATASQFERDYSVLSADITAKIGKIPNLFGKDKHDLTGEVERLLEEANDLIEQIEVESHATSGDNRKQVTKNLANYRRDYDTHTKNLRKAKMTYTDNEARSELLEGDEHKGAMMSNTEKLDRASRRLDDGYKIAMETEQVGQDILNNLAQDKEKIQRSRARLQTADSSLTQSSRLLNNMYRRVIQNKVMTAAIGLIIVVIIVFAVYGMLK